MEILSSVAIFFVSLFISGNEDFFKTSKLQIEQGKRWHYVGMQPTDQNSKSLPLRDCDNCQDYIIYKLK